MDSGVLAGLQQWLRVEGTFALDLLLFRLDFPHPL